MNPNLLYGLRLLREDATSGKDGEKWKRDEQYLVIDSMCGRLARWLRMLGFNTHYDREVDDVKLLSKVKDGGGLLITRDASLHRRALKEGLSSILLKSSNHAEQLATLANELKSKFKFDPDSSRCPACNSLLRKVSRDEVMGKVPEKSFKLYSVFWVCTRCNKVYWQGSHWPGILKVLKKVESMSI